MSFSVGMAHYALTLFLGPRLVCAFGGECIDPMSGQLVANNIFNFPLSAAQTALVPVFSGESFPLNAAINSLAFAALVWAVLFVVARLRAKAKPSVDS
ncbi:MAG: hypothetical protein A3E01_07660 [Gammaproteobacteria bacterium RIFCSPHIGHO2_12_FULL_63_22]|nr:MAG: hypothetical protein A3E01_07660 [Gammaproteobacteria bacterium RIFCSPHIGHO2_12_FULL_63_22]